MPLDGGPGRPRTEPRLTLVDIRGANVVDKLLGVGKTQAEKQAAKDARQVFDATLAALPSHDALTVGLVADLARCRALQAFWTTRQEQDGLDSEEGVLAAQRADAYAKRAERLSMTALTVAKEQAARRDTTIDAHAALVDAANDAGG